MSLVQFILLAVLSLHGLFAPVRSEVTHVTMETMIQRDTLVKKDRVDADYIHEVVFALKQKNLDFLEKLVIDMSTPGHRSYQQWLTFEEVGNIIANHEAEGVIDSWLSSEKISVSWKSKRSEYIKASAKVSVWERIFATTFYLWEEHAYEGNVTNHVLAEEYSLPEFLLPHISAVFFTCQAPPVVNKHAVRMPSGSEAITTLVVTDGETGRSRWNHIGCSFTRHNAMFFQHCL